MVTCELAPLISRGYCSSLPIPLSPLFFFFFFFFNITLDKEVNISMRFIINLSVFNFFEPPSCRALPRVHETWVMSRALSQPVREVFQLPHKSARRALSLRLLPPMNSSGTLHLRWNKNRILTSWALNYSVPSYLLPAGSAR